MMTPYLCCKTGQLIERKAHHSRSCRLSAVWRIAPGGGTWRENSCRRVPKICRRLAPSISTSLNYMRCSTQPHTFCSDGDDWPAWIGPEKIESSWDEQCFKKQPFCSACKCQLHCPAPRPQHARPLPFFQTSAADPFDKIWTQGVL